MKNYEKAKSICITMLSGETESINADIIKKTVEQVNILCNLPGEQTDSLREELEVLYAILSDQYRIIDDKKTVPWVKNVKSEISWKFWNRYRILMEHKNYAPDTINKTDNLTDDILDRLVRPGGNLPFDKRGLIVGHVQSGKTGNYIGLICKAADAGYKLIVVLAGIHNTLRSQTQLRIDEGFLGFDTQLARSFTQTTNRIGVGRIDPNLAAHSLTTNEINGDFNRRVSESSGINIRGNDPIILVIKKNTSVMKNLLGWLATRGETMLDGKKQIKNLPLLVIDDEADNASINISKNYVSGINACIRSMLKLFEQSAYIGYTATPYANIFIKQYTDDDVKGLDYSVHNIPLALGKDIFPKNFIVNIPAPSNYIGPEKLFGIESIENYEKEIFPLQLFRIINDYELYIKDHHKKDDDKPERLPPSLHKAIKCFFLSCAARRVRGQETEHNSMLIHLTRFINWQDKIASLVEKEVKDYARLIEFSDSQFLKELELLWQEEFIPATQKIMNNPSINDPAIRIISWTEIEPHLYPAVAKVEVRAIHGDTKIERLEYKNIRPLDYYDNRQTGLSVIAVGGNKLSRGLTLEGLTISYFLRASKMYDTLMQMGRWFGYRPGYIDLCRLFTSAELVEWYQHITVATEDMRAEFDRMGDLDKTPEDYGLKIRTHPGALVITASSKFRYKKIMELSYSGELEETYSFRKNDPANLTNYNLILPFIHNLGLPDGAVNSEPGFRNHFIWRGTNNADTIINLISSYQTRQLSFNVKLMSDYILAQQARGILTDWTIVLINNTDDKQGIQITPNIKTGLTLRSNDFKQQSDYYTIAKSHIIDPRHEYIDLDDFQIKKALEESVEDAIKKGNKNILKISKPSPIRIKKNRRERQGLLLIYLLNPQPDKNKPSLSDIPFVGLALSFPWIEKDEKVEYAVNEQFLKELDYPDELDEEEIDEPLLAEKEESNTEAQSSLRRVIENNGILNKNLFLKYNDGINISYSKQFIEGDSRMFAIPDQISGSVPLIRTEDIDRYYTKLYSDFHVVNAGQEQINPKSIISPVIYKGQKFTLHEGGFVVDNSCLTIQCSGIPEEYLLAIFNSALFSFYNTERKGEKTEQVVKEFPVTTQNQNNTGITVLVQSILFLQKDQSSRDNQIMSSYFMNVLDVAVFEIYFPEIFKTHHLNILSELEKLNPVENNNAEQIKDYYLFLNETKSPVKKAVYFINTIPEFKLIYQTLTDEN
jgi:Z1 domain.